MTDIKEKVRKAEEETNASPTEGQKLGGNYKKGKVLIKGFKISVENPVGEYRTGKDKDGKTWKSKMFYTYGYFNGTVGKDGDPIDVFLGNILDKEFDIYVIDQVDEKTRAFDEHKVMFGFKSQDAAKKAYLRSYEKGWTGFGNITPMKLEVFRKWIKNAEMIKYPASKLLQKKFNIKNLEQERLQRISLNGEVVEEQTLKDLKEQAGDPENFDTLILEIASPGGDVTEGLSIMVWLDMISQMGKQVVTVVTANAYSIASLIMLAADYKLISQHGEVMVHNPMIPKLKYANANMLEGAAEELRRLESVMYELYQMFTGIDQDKIKALMDEESYISPKQAVSLGFADQVINIEKRPYAMAINTSKTINMSKTLNILNRVIAKVNGSSIVNQFYYDQEGGSVEIYQADPAQYSVGDRITTEEPEVILYDGSKLFVEDGIITKIDKNVETVAEEAEAPETTEEEVIVPVEPVVDEAPVEEVIEPIIETEEPVAPETEVKGKNDMPSSIIETTESTKTTVETVAVATEEKQEEVVASSEGAAPEEILSPEAVAEEVNQSEEILKAILAKLEGLEVKIGELSKQGGELEADMKQMKDFEEIATEAIDSIASNVTSNFKPEAKVIVGDTPKGSIFDQARKRVGSKK